MKSSLFGKRTQIIIICVVVIVILYQILDEHIALILDENSQTSYTSLWPNVDCNNSFNNNNNNNNHHHHQHKNHSHSHHELYFVNEIALHTELIGYSYSNELKIRKENFQNEIESFTKIGVLCCLFLFIYRYMI